MPAADVVGELLQLLGAPGGQYQVGSFCSKSAGELGALVIVALERRVALRWGRAIAVYFIWNGIGRAYLESIRIDPTSGGFLGVPDNEWASFVLIALGVVLFSVQLQRHPGPEPDVQRNPHPRAESDEVVALGAGQRGTAKPEVLNDSGSEVDTTR